MHTSFGARSMMTKTLAAAKEEEELTGGKKLGQVFRSSAMLKGVDPSKLAAELTQMTLPKEAQESIGEHGFGAQRVRVLEGASQGMH